MPVPTLHHVKDILKLNFSNRPAEAVEAVELKVHMDCPGCERTVRKSLSHLKGIHSVDIDREQQKVTVTGFVDKNKVLNRVRRKGKIAEEWAPMESAPEEKVAEEEEDMTIPTTFVYSYDPTLTGVVPQPAYVYSYDPTLTGVVPMHYGIPPRVDVQERVYPYSARPHGPVVETFSEDNPNNCSIM